MQKFIFIRSLSFICSRVFSSNASNPNYRALSLSSFHFRNFSASESDSSFKNPNPLPSENEFHRDNPTDDVSSAELKTQIDKFYKGDFEAIPTIFESILKRKLAGKHEDSDDELLNEFRQYQPNEVIDEESDLSSTESDSDE